MKHNFDKKLCVFASLRENFSRFTWLLSLSLLLLSVTLSFAADVEKKRWSFKFKDTPFSDALTQITKTTGVKITTTAPIDKKIPKKTFKNKTIAQILNNLLKGENYVMLWDRDDKGSHSILISILAKADQKRGGGGIEPLQKSVSVVHVGESKETQVRAATPPSTRKVSGGISKVKRTSSPPPPQTRRKPIISGKTDSSDPSTPGTNPDTNNAPSLEQGQPSAPPQPAPEKTSSLEPPPMPPGVK